MDRKARAGKLRVAYSVASGSGNLDTFPSRGVLDLTIRPSPRLDSRSRRTEIGPMSTMPAAASPAHALPPGPRSPAWWQLVRFAGDPLGLLDECHARHGDAFTLDVAGH